MPKPNTACYIILMHIVLVILTTLLPLNKAGRVDFSILSVYLCYPYKNESPKFFCEALILMTSKV